MEAVEKTDNYYLMEEVMGLVIDDVKKELNDIFVECIEKHIKFADEYGLDRNILLKQFGEKVSITAEISDFSKYVCKTTE